MTREEYVKVCRICENRKQDYEHGMVCGLTGRKADFEDKCPSFVTDNEAVMQTQNAESYALNNNYNNYSNPTEVDDYDSGGITWQSVLGIVLTIIAVVRLIVALNR